MKATFEWNSSFVRKMKLYASTSDGPLQKPWVSTIEPRVFGTKVFESTVTFATLLIRSTACFVPKYHNNSIMLNKISYNKWQNWIIISKKRKICLEIIIMINIIMNTIWYDRGMANWELVLHINYKFLKRCVEFVMRFK